MPAEPRSTGAGPLALAEATVTVTVYVAVELSAAVTVYATGVVKLFCVVPLVCATVPTFTPEPVVENVAGRFVRIVPFGTVTVMLFGVAVSFIFPVTPASEYTT